MPDHRTDPASAQQALVVPLDAILQLTLAAARDAGAPTSTYEAKRTVIKAWETGQCPLYGDRRVYKGRKPGDDKPELEVGVPLLTDDSMKCVTFDWETGRATYEVCALRDKRRVRIALIEYANIRGLVPTAVIVQMTNPPPGYHLNRTGGRRHKAPPTDEEIDRTYRELKPQMQAYAVEHRTRPIKDDRENLIAKLFDASRDLGCTLNKRQFERCVFRPLLRDVYAEKRKAKLGNRA